ncbi:MAG: hypothetical protein EP345_06075 [Sphingomonadales bacterium]|nr:hypothetical protein [Pseudomonadota bacterium]TNE42764.1 MAG: hypothetical protein EP345_06075 [Sphingomonadales bacterium]
MSTSTLLIVSTALRSHGAGHRNRPVPSGPLNGRDRALTHLFQISGAATRLIRSGSPKDGQDQVAVQEAVMDRLCQRPARAAGAALAIGQRPLTLFPNPRTGSRQFLRRAVTAGSPDTLFIGRASLALASFATLFLAGSALAQTAETSAEAPPLAIELDPAEVRAPAPQRISGSGPQPCVIVDIAGTRAGHLDCATGRLQEAARAAQAESRAGLEAPTPGAGSPDVQVGVAHQAATRLRMGDALGRSVHPERPNSRPPTTRGPR